MALVMTSGPAAEPVTVAEAKAHLRIDHNTEDVLIGSLILTSRLHIEAALGIALIAQGWRLLLDRWPRGAKVQVPLSPMIGVSEIRVRDADGTPVVVPTEFYAVDAASVGPRIVRLAANWPEPGRVTHGIEIDFTAGFGAAASDVPAPLRQAVLLLVAHWYEHRDPIEIGSEATVIPHGISELVAPWRKARL